MRHWNAINAQSSIFRYWGKRDTRLILPTNSSLSVTLDQDHLRSTTTSRADERFTDGDRLWLNGKEEAVKSEGRLGVCIRELKAWRREMEDGDASLPKVGGSRLIVQNTIVINSSMLLGFLHKLTL